MSEWRRGIPTRAVVEAQERPVDFDHPPMAAFMTRYVGVCAVVVASWEARENCVRFDMWAPFGMTDPATGTLRAPCIRIFPATDQEFRPIDPATGDPLPWIAPPSE